MEWIDATRRGQPFRSGRAWTTAGSQRSAGWRWHERPFGGLPFHACPLGEICSVAAGLLSRAALDLEDGPASAGRTPIWLDSEDPN